MNLVVKDVKVDKLHIAKGKCGNERTCAVALALAAQLPASTKNVQYRVTVDGDNARYSRTNLRTKKATRMIVALPDAVKTFISRFDESGAAKRIFSYEKGDYITIKPIRFTTAVPVKG